MAGSGAEMKISTHKRFAITSILLFSLLVSCLPMSDERIYAKAEEMYTQLEKPMEEEEGEEGEVSDLDEKDLADEQILHISGRFINYLDPTSA